MANELGVIFGWNYSKNGCQRTKATVQDTVTIAGNGRIENIQSIGTAAHEALALGDVTTPRFAFFKNLDATNYIQIGIDSGGSFVPFLRLEAGQETQCYLAVSAPYAKANTGACLLDYMILDA